MTVQDRVDDDVIDRRFDEYWHTRDRRVRDQLVADHQWLANRSARRFAHRGEPFADLLQVAQIGLVKAVDRFDPTLGNHFPSFATPTVLGELRRHFRDTTWRVSVPRRSKELITRLNSTIEMLTQTLERAPRVDEVAEAMGVDSDVVLETMEANLHYRTASLDEPSAGGDGDGAPSDGRAGTDDPELTSADTRVTTLAALRKLDERSRQIVTWRFYEGCTQSEIGERLGIGQVQVSRLLRGALARMRTELGQSNENR